MLEIKDHERFNTLSHLFAMFCSVFGTAYLLYRAIYLNQIWHFVAFVVYALSTVGLFAISAVYHGTDGDKKNIYRQMDYIGIYLKIAGNYTPYTILFLSGQDLILVLGSVWILAFVGIFLEFIFQSRKRNLALILYVLMASSILLAAGHFVQHVSKINLILIALGYSFYAVGVVFFLNDHKWKFAHEVWHVCVIGGSFFHFLPLAVYLTFSI